MSDDFIKEIQDSFLVEALELLQKSEEMFLALEKPGDHSEVFAQLKRLAHNFKGSGKAVGFDALSLFSHRLENLLIALSEAKIPLNDNAVQLLLECNDRLKGDIDQLRQNSQSPLNYDSLISQIDGLLLARDDGDVTKKLEVLTAEQVKKNQEQFIAANLEEKKEIAPKTISSKPAPAVAATSVDDSVRIPRKRIDELLDIFGEQVIYLSALDHYKNDLVLHKDDLIRTIFNLKKLAFDIQQSALNLRMVTLKTLFSKLERAVRDASKMTGKKVDCVILGAEQELDKVIVDQLSDPLTHMVRNAVDHGLESVEDRAASGKGEVGRVTLIAKREGGSFVIEIRDDGRGMDPEKLRVKAVEKGLLRADDIRDEKALFDLIFENGFSTKENVSELSGRGVGMNVVKEMILALKGSCEIDSKKGKGTTFKIKLPLSLSLFNGILFQVHENRYLVPSSQVAEIINASEIEIREVSSGRKVAQIRDDVIDLVELSNYLGIPVGASSMNVQPQMILVSETQGGRVGFLVQRVLSIQRVVQKPLSPEMTACPGAVGVTILGDGFPSVILDLKALQGLYLPRRAA